MAIHYRTNGFILKKNNRFEADRVFTIFTHDFGRVEILAKAIRKITSKLRAGIELFYLSEIEFIQGKNYKTLTDTAALEKFKNVRQNLKKLETAFTISDVLDNFLKFEEQDKEIWNLTIKTFERLNNLSDVYCQRLFFYFLWNLFSILGYQPEVFKCVLCQKKLIPNNLYFFAQGGGIICHTCVESKKEVEKINSDVVKILRMILRKDWQTLSRLKVESSSQELLKNISENYLSFLLREHPKSDIIQRI